MMGILNEKYQRFRQWQQQPLDYHDTHEHHVCHNCGAESDNNYCPRCGQKAIHGPMNWRSVWQGVLDVWGVGTRSLPYTLWQLLWRPGYLIRDYISGKRQVSFPPVKMLVIVAVVLFFVGQWFFPEFWGLVDEPESEVSTATGVLYYLETLGNWLSDHMEWAFLALFSLLIVPTWLVFRYAPRYPGHSLPQGFFIQVFMTVQFLVWIFIGSLVIKLLDVSDVDAIMTALIFSTMFLVILIDYHQLFGYGWWGTLWRIIAMFVMMYILIFFVALPLVIAGKVMSDGSINVGPLSAKIIGMSVLGIIFFVAVDAINRRSWQGGKKRLKYVILMFAALVMVFILIDANLDFKFMSTIMRYFKSLTEIFING